MVTVEACFNPPPSILPTHHPSYRSLSGAEGLFTFHALTKKHLSPTADHHHGQVLGALSSMLAPRASLYISSMRIETLV